MSSATKTARLSVLLKRGIRTDPRTAQVAVCALDKRSGTLAYKATIWDFNAIRTAGEYLCRWGFTPKKPIKRTYEQQPAQIRKWLDEAYPSIVRKARKHGAEIHWCDETGLSSEANVCRGYSPLGTKPVMRTSGQRFSVSMISSITNQGQLKYMVYMPNLMFANGR